VAIDRYGSFLHIQEYAPPASVNPRLAALRLEQVQTVASEVLGVSPERIFVKVRQRQKGLAQYEKLATEGALHQVTEGPCKFLVNFTDHLDTGLFLDHRPTREHLGSISKGKRFLNLFGYTGTASVWAALGGATSTTTVDLSNTYLEWAQKNLELNGVTGDAHKLVRADCLAWLAETTERFDVIFVDPPTFSASKSMDGTFDVQRDHEELLRRALQVLAPGGTLIFSTNFRRFKLSAGNLQGVELEDLTGSSVPYDFRRRPRIHRCWSITKPESGVTASAQSGPAKRRTPPPVEIEAVQPGANRRRRRPRRAPRGQAETTPSSDRGAPRHGRSS
jgi:23S rRNA (guanine2445-N2)-methyltransferase / 23S rRNA (guanine2069-N7)-methyltransferase